MTNRQIILQFKVYNPPKLRRVAQGYCVTLSRTMFSLGRPDLPRMWSSKTDASFHVFWLHHGWLKSQNVFLSQLSIACGMRPSKLIRLRTLADQVRGVLSSLQRQYWAKRRFTFLPHSEDLTKLRWDANFKFKYYLSIGRIICGLDVITVLCSILLFGTPWCMTKLYFRLYKSNIIWLEVKIEMNNWPH